MRPRPENPQQPRLAEMFGGDALRDPRRMVHGAGQRVAWADRSRTRSHMRCVVRSRMSRSAITREPYRDIVRVAGASSAITSTQWRLM